jgi:hypothetical protein
MTGVGKLVHVKALVSFMDIREGDESVMELDATLQGWLDAGFVKVVGEVSVTVEDGGPGVATLVLEGEYDGTDQAGSGGTEPDDAGSKQGTRRRRR